MLISSIDSCNIIYTHLSVHIERIFRAINAMCMTFSCPTLTERSCNVWWRLRTRSSPVSCIQSVSSLEELLTSMIDSTLPTQVDHFHSLVPLDTVNQKSAATFGYPSWIYKAVSTKDGKLYALRRLEGTSSAASMDSADK